MTDAEAFMPALQGTEVVLADFILFLFLERDLLIEALTGILHPSSLPNSESP